jgi:DNA helicase-2/ATP-dependent DNA helicase PcrA
VTFYADLHIHSKYSRATSRDCDLEHVACWARKKGISVVATGDFTHPEWFEEIQQKLVPAEPGLYRLQPDLEKEVDDWLGGLDGSPVRFILEVEISTIYKKGDRTRKVHHLIYVPDFEKARHLRDSLARVGNIGSDGRPILGLDSRHLLEIALECGEGSYLVPAHIWTPWFAVLGSKSGFEAIEECYDDLTTEIFALETGLSSDPPMNWRLSGLDRFTLISNSDAHSPSKLGRECCVFHTDMDYFAMRRALETGEGYGGTVEFFPEEGKYHYDGHRKCGVCFSPEETRRNDCRCPVCGKPITLGVMHRVCELADRTEIPATPSSPAKAFRSLIPLGEVLAEILGVGSNTKSVQRKYEGLISQIGPELVILEHAPLEDVRRGGSPVLAEAISRMRQGRVIREAGFDGQYGTIRLFTKNELRRGTTVGLLFDMAEDDQQPRSDRDKPLGDAITCAEDGLPVKLSRDREKVRGAKHASTGPAGGGILDQLDPQQRAAALITHGPLLIIAGPGTGKTRTLTHRIAHLIAQHGVGAQECLAITFTRRAAGEMTERFQRLLPDEADQLPVMTFHALGLSILQEHGTRLGLAQPVRVASQTECSQVLRDALSVSERKATRLLARISRKKRRSQEIAELGQESAANEDEETGRALEAYEKGLRARGLVDFDDLVILPVRLLEAAPDLVQQYRSRYRWVSVDEYQDIDHFQYRLIKLLVPAGGNLCAIGDPDQAIYGFRGSDVGYFQRFAEDYPSAMTVSLVHNYRSTNMIVDASQQLIAPTSLSVNRSLQAQLESLDRIEIHECTTDRSEAELVVHAIERSIGGSTFFSMDSGRVDTGDGQSLSFADFAVLYRTDAQAETLAEAFERSGMPFQKRSHGRLADQPGVPELARAMSDLPNDLPVPDRLEQAAEIVCADEPQLGPLLPSLRLLARRHDENLDSFLSELALGVDVDLWDGRADCVWLLTLHAAKGLEFPVVFITGCEDGLVPLHWGSPDQSDLAEERRLLFVGMTRAQQRLVLTHARRRWWRGKVRRQEISPFLHDIQEQLLARHQHRPTKKRSRRQDQRTLFEL